MYNFSNFTNFLKLIPLKSFNLVQIAFLTYFKKYQKADIGKESYLIY